MGGREPSRWPTRALRFGARSSSTSTAPASASRMSALTTTSARSPEREHVSPDAGRARPVCGLGRDSGCTFGRMGSAHDPAAVAWSVACTDELTVTCAVRPGGHRLWRFPRLSTCSSRHGCSACPGATSTSAPPDSSELPAWRWLLAAAGQRLRPLRPRGTRHAGTDRSAPLRGSRRRLPSRAQPDVSRQLGDRGRIRTPVPVLVLGGLGHDPVPRLPPVRDRLRRAHADSALR